MSESNSENNKNKSEKKEHKIVNPKRFGAFILSLLVTAGGIGYSVNGIIDKNHNGHIDAFEPLKLSNETTDYYLEEGEGFNEAAMEVEGSDKTDLRELVYDIKNMPENKDIPLIPEAHTKITIPVSVETN